MEVSHVYVEISWRDIEMDASTRIVWCNSRLRYCMHVSEFEDCDESIGCHTDLGKSSVVHIAPTNIIDSSLSVKEQHTTYIVCPHAVRAMASD